MSLRPRFFLFLLPPLLAGSGLALRAQATTGALTLVVTDRSTHEALVGAHVVLSSPALFKNRTYQVDARGQVRDVLLPVGNYTASVSRPGFLDAKVLDIRVGLGVKLATNVDLAPLSALPGVTVFTAIAAHFDVDGGVDVAE